MTTPAHHPDTYKPVEVWITHVAELGATARQHHALYPGCDVVVWLDHRLKLRGATIRDAARVYALALEYTRHRPRSVHITGAGLVLREAVAEVIATAFPDCQVTHGSPRNAKSGPIAARRVPSAHVIAAAPPAQEDH